MRNVLFVLLLTVAMSLSACSGVMQLSMSRENLRALDVGAEPGSLPAEVELISAESDGETLFSIDTQRKVIYAGRFKIIVGDVRQAIDKTRRLAGELGGYTQRISGNAIVIRVPSQKFDDAAIAVKDMGAVMLEDINAEDVTELYTDLEVRLANRRVLLKRLQDLLGKTKTLDEALQMERELARVRTEIERLEGQINSLASRVAYATLSIGFVQVEDKPQKVTQRKVRTNLPIPWLQGLGLRRLINN